MESFNKEELNLIKECIEDTLLNASASFVPQDQEILKEIDKKKEELQLLLAKVKILID